MRTSFTHSQNRRKASVARVPYVAGRVTGVEVGVTSGEPCRERSGFHRKSSKSLAGFSERMVPSDLYFLWFLWLFGGEWMVKE